MATSFKVSGLWQATLFKVYSLDFASQRSFEKPQQEQDQPPNLIARKRSAQAEGGGVKERSSRTPAYRLARIRTAHSDWKAAGSGSRIEVLDPPS